MVTSSPLKTFQSGDTKIAYSVTGSGPAVLLIQGTGLAGQAWEPQVSGFAPNYTVITFDNRGVGKSELGAAISIEIMANDAWQLLNHLGINRAHIVGHSLGGSVAQQLALSHPEIVESLSLLCAFPKGSDALAMTWRKFWVSIRTAIGTRNMKRRAFLELVTSPQRLRAHPPEPLTDDLTRTFGRDLADQPPIAFKQLLALSKFDPGLRLSSLGSLRTLIVSGTDDLISTPAMARSLTSKIPNAKFISLDGEGHALTVQCAKKINEILLTHFSNSQ
jgi:3-oxoadipate enol-lactonase